MPSKNKPKRLDRNRSWRVARRKKRKALIASDGKKRSRAKRPKHKGAVTTKEKSSKAPEESDKE